MTAFIPISVQDALASVEAAKIVPASQALADFAEAGLVKGYARLIETIYPDGRREEVRDKRISRELWRQIVAEDRVDDVATGTVRLSGSAGFGGGFRTNIIGIRFGPLSVDSLTQSHGRAPKDTAVNRPTKVVEAAAASIRSAAPSPHDTSEMPKAERGGIPEGAEMCSVDQACVTLNMGRTKLYELIDAGVFTKHKNGRNTALLVSEIRRYIEGSRA